MPFRGIILCYAQRKVERRQHLPSWVREFFFFSDSVRPVPYNKWMYGPCRCQCCLCVLQPTSSCSTTVMYLRLLCILRKVLADSPLAQVPAVPINVILIGQGSFGAVISEYRRFVKAKLIPKRALTHTHTHTHKARSSHEQI